MLVLYKATNVNTEIDGEKSKRSPDLGHPKVFDGGDFIACEPVCERRDGIWD